MNDFNINLNNQRNLLKDKLKENKIKDIRLDNLLKVHNEKEKYKLKYNGVKMVNRPKELKINENIPNIKLDNNSKYNINSNNNKNIGNLINNGFLSDRTKYTENENSKSISNIKYFIYSKEEKVNINKKRKLNRGLSQRDFTLKTMGIFDKVISNYQKRKEFLKLDIFPPQIINIDSNEKRKRSKTIQHDAPEENILLKEVIILKNHEINPYSYNNNKIMNKYISGKQDKNKKINKELMKKLNIYKTGDEKEMENEIYIVNKNFLKRLFDKNMNKVKKNKMDYTNNFNRNSISKRMIYYNTGRYDMPFVSHLNLKSTKKINFIS